MSLYPNRRYQKAMSLTAHVMHILDKHLPRDADTRAIYREIEDLFYAAGAEIITEADRITAGLMPRDHNGLTLEEIRILDNKHIQAMLQPMPIFPKDTI